MPTCQKKFEHPKRKNKGRRKNTIKQTKIVKEVHTGRNRWKATGKVQNPGNGLFSLPYISHNVHYTKIMLSKNKVSSLIHFEFRNLIFQMALIWFNLIVPTASSPLQLRWKYQIGALLQYNLIHPTAVYQNTRRWLRNRYVLLFYSLLRCRTAQRLPRSLQSTVPPILPDNLNLPES